jgi:molybdate transport system substrate-binding protein
MPRLWLLLLLGLAVSVNGASNANSASAAETLHVAVASNFSEVLKSLKADIEKELAAKLIISSASTGKLSTQVLQGAPFDVLLTADDSSYRTLLHHGKGVLHLRYTRGQLVYYSAKALEQQQAWPEVLVLAKPRRIAIANPKLAPYGRAARDLLDDLNLPFTYQAIGAENVAQAFHFIRTGHSDAGFVALSAIKLAGIDDQYFRSLPIDSYKPLYQQALLLNNRELSLAFSNLLLSADFQQRIQQMGYLPID